MLARLRYVLAEVSIGLRRNAMMTMATMLTITVTCLLVGGGLLVQRQVALVQDVLYADVEVSMYLQDRIAPETQQSLLRDLEAQDVVAEVVYESKEKALENAKKIFAEDPILLKDTTADALPASFRIKLKDPEQFQVIASMFEGREGVEEIVDQRDSLNNFFAIMGQIRQFTLGMSILIAIASSMLIATTIRLTAFARREQTAIMRLVGATSWYIRGPFMIEGIITGLIGSVIACGLLAVGVRLYASGLSESVKFLPFIGLGDVLAVSPILILGTVLASALISMEALRRFLQV